jgi:hypothetical protein
MRVCWGGPIWEAAWLKHIILHFATPGIPVGVRHKRAAPLASDVAPHISSRLAGAVTREG